MITLSSVDNNVWRIAQPLRDSGDAVPLAMTKSVQVSYLPLDSPDDMHQAQKDALDLNYYGVVETNSIGDWMIRLSGAGNPEIRGMIGETLIWNGTAFSKIPSVDFLDNYDPIP